MLSTHSGIVHASEGEVWIDTTPVPEIHARFPDLPVGSVLSTGEGDVELLLAPEVFLWVGHDSAVRMLDKELADAQIEIVRGSAILKSGNFPGGVRITVMHEGMALRLAPNSSHRIDITGSGAPELEAWARQRRKLLATDNQHRIDEVVKANDPHRARSARYPMHVTPFPGRG